MSIGLFIVISCLVSTAFSASCGNVNCGDGQSCCLNAQNVGQCYAPSTYSCSNGVLCPAGMQACGSACFSPSQYYCANGQLQQTGSPGSSTGTSAPTQPPPSTSGGTVTTTTTTTRAPTPTPTTTRAPTPTPTTTRAPTTQSPNGTITVKLYGLDYNPRTSTGACPSLANVEEDVRILSAVTYRLRIYSVVDCNAAQLLIQAIRNTGVDIKVTLGIWLDQYHAAEFPNEYNALINLISSVGLSNVEAIIVGSETQYRGDVPTNSLVGYLQNISSLFAGRGFNNIVVSTTDVIYNLKYLPQITNVERVVYANEFPFWEGKQINEAAPLIADQVGQLQASTRKPVIVSETGWPTCGQNYGSAAVGVQNLQTYLKQTVCYFHKNNIGYFWFQAYDQPWQDAVKQGGVEQCFGLFTANKQLKSGLTLPVVCPA